MSVYNVIYRHLRTAGYGPEDAKAIIWIAKAAPSCVTARRWWTAEAQRFSPANIDVLLENVRHLAAKYSVAFLS